MTRNVATITAGSSLPAAIRLMLDRHVSGLPVLDHAGAIVGILTEGDVLRRVELSTDTHPTGWLQFLLGPRRLAEDYVNTRSRIVGDVMTSGVSTVDVAAPLADVVALMQAKRVKRVPVLSGPALVGVVSRSDLLRTLSDTFAMRPVTGQSDLAIHKNILSELGRQSWAPRAGVSVVVSDGVVDLEGVIFEESERNAIRVATANVPGVKQVRDHLTWVEPNSGMSFPPP